MFLDNSKPLIGTEVWQKNQKWWCQWLKCKFLLLFFVFYDFFWFNCADNRLINKENKHLDGALILWNGCKLKSWTVVCWYHDVRWWCDQVYLRLSCSFTLSEKIPQWIKFNEKEKVRLRCGSRFPYEVSQSHCKTHTICCPPLYALR